MSEPKQKPGRSKQDYGTPADFMAAVTERFGAPTIDLAASRDNAVAPEWIDEDLNALALRWPDNGILWLNPPFGNIGPWAERCRKWMWHTHLATSRLLFLTPASVGSNWFAEHVYNRARVYALSPRLTFKGCTAPFPKDCILSVYGEPPGFETWRWK